MGSCGQRPPSCYYLHLPSASCPFSPFSIRPLGLGPVRSPEKPAEGEEEGVEGEESSPGTDGYVRERVVKIEEV